MRAYLAVIKDSFRETLASRVLWILIALITLILLALAPFSLKSEAATRFERSDFQSGPEFLKSLAAAEKEETPTLRRHVASLLSDELRKQLREMPADDAAAQAGILNSVRNEFNGLLDSSDLYDANAVKDAKLGDEAKKLVDRGPDNLSQEERRRMNRLLLEAAFPGDFASRARGALSMSYLGYRFGPELPFAADQIEFLVKTVLANLIGFLAGVLGVFVAILVTSSIIPQMFEPGAIDLLLSKPVSRSLLFLSRFFGACVFVLLNTAYLIVGLWLIVGVQFGIWSHRLLLCIPVFLFLFAIYYSVSALAGVIWRNAVVSVVITILFWALCFSVGTSKDVIETTFLNPTRLAVLLPADDSLLVVNKGNQAFEWNTGQRVWNPVFESGRSQDFRQLVVRNNVIGPVYDAKNERIVAVENMPSRFEAFNGAGKLLIGARKSDWARIEGTATPNGVGFAQIEPSGTILVAGTSGVHRFEGDPTVEHVPFMIFGRDFGRAKKGGKFVDVASKLPTLRRPFAASLSPDAGELAIVSDGRLITARKDTEGKFVLGKERDLETKSAAIVAHGGKSVLVGLGSGELRLYTAETLEPRASFQPFGSQKPRTATASPDGRWIAVAFHDRSFWLLDAVSGEPVDLRVRGSQDVSAAAFTPSNQLLLADRFARVTEYEPESQRMNREYVAPSDTLELVYRYAILPIYTIFPKPGELTKLVSYLLTEEQTVSFDRRAAEDDLRAERVVLDIWSPVWSNLAFMTVVLTLTCVYIARHDF